MRSYKDQLHLCKKVKRFYYGNVSTSFFDPGKLILECKVAWCKSLDTHCEAKSCRKYRKKRRKNNETL